MGNQLFSFKARSAGGNKVHGHLEAAGRKEALKILDGRQLTVIDLKQGGAGGQLFTGKGSVFVERIGSLVRGCSSRDLMIFCRQFSTMLGAGVPILHCLEVLGGQAEKRAFGEKLNRAALSLEEGCSFSEALRSENGYFPPLLVNMVEAGETGGMLDEVMEKMADHYEKEHDFEEKVRSATAYPLLVSAVAAAVVLVMIFFVLPQFAEIFGSIGLDMPLFSRLLLGAAGRVSDNWALLLAVPAACAVALYRLAATEKGRLQLDRLRLALPLYGKIYQRTLAARFARTLATLLSGGVTLHEALTLADRAAGNSALSLEITELGRAVNRGETLAAPLRTGRHFPPLLAEMVRIGEETGSLDLTLNRTAAYYEKEVSYMLNRLGSILEPSLLLTVGIIVGLIVYSVLSPIYRIFEMI